MRNKKQALMRNKKIVQHINTHACVSAVMSDSLDSWTAPEDKKGSDPWRKLDCPLVVAIPD